MWWTALIGLAQQQSQAPTLPAYAQQYAQQQQQQSDWPIIIGTVFGLGIAGYVAYRVLR